MKCDSCDSERILQTCGKTSDRLQCIFKGKETLGYAPKIKNICGGDYIEPDICLECGKVQGEFPVEDPDMEEE